MLGRSDVIARKQVGYVRSPNSAELMFQVPSDRAKQPAATLTANLPFAEWNPGHSQCGCEALLDHSTARSRIIRTASNSYPFRRTLELRSRGARTHNGMFPNHQPSTKGFHQPRTSKDDYRAGVSA
jgi:hypothetical protein